MEVGNQPSRRWVVPKKPTETQEKFLTARSCPNRWKTADSLLKCCFCSQAAVLPLPARTCESLSSSTLNTFTLWSVKKVSRLKAAGRVELDAAWQLNVATVFPSSVAWMKGKTTFSALDFI